MFWYNNVKYDTIQDYRHIKYLFAPLGKIDLYLMSCAQNLKRLMNMHYDPLSFYFCYMDLFNVENLVAERKYNKQNLTFNLLADFWNRELISQEITVPSKTSGTARHISLFLLFTEIWV